MSFQNPQNPYVLDELLFLNQPHFVFNGSTFALVHRIVNIVISSLGILTSCMLVYLALFKTPVHVKSFSRMILLCSVTDILYSLSELWCMPRFQINKAGMIFTITGPASLFSYEVQCYSINVKSTMQALGYILLPVQYIFRYQTIKKNAPPTLLQSFPYIIPCLLLGVLCTFLGAKMFCSTENTSQIDIGQFWYKEVPIPTLIVAIKEQPVTLFYTTFFTACISFGYVLAIFYARRTVTELGAQATYMSSRTIALQRQIGRGIPTKTYTPKCTLQNVHSKIYNP